MSGIAGCCHFDEAVIATETVTALGLGIAECGNDGNARIVHGRAVLLHRAFSTGRTPAPPQHFDSGGISIVWDGRIDNRSELKNGGAAASDVEHIAALYRADPDGNFLAPVVGDFSFALWDSLRRTLILARDAFGARPLYYHATEERVVWATRLDPLLDPLLGIDPAIDDHYLGGFLTGMAGAEETPYKAIRLAPAGTMLVFTPGGKTVRRFWSLHSTPDVVLGSDREYEERLLGLLRESVAARLQTDRPMAAELSGGLDSSTIVCLATGLIREGAVPAPNLVTLSYVFDEAKGADERRFIGAVEETIGQRGKHLREEDHRLLSTLGEVASPLYPTAEVCFLARHRHVAETMEAAGTRVLLRGIGGDQVLVGEFDRLYEPYDHFRARRFVAMHRSLRTWAPALRTSYFDLLRRSVLRPLMGRSGYLGHDHGLSWWLSPEFAKRAHIEERVHELPAAGTKRRPSWRAHVKSVGDLANDLSVGYYLERGAIEVSYPFLHRPLVEFCLGTPLEQKLRPGETRSVLRRAMGGILPPLVARRRGKAGPDSAIVRAFAREWPVLHDLFSDSRAAAHGIIDRDTFLGALTRARYGINIDTPSLLRIISIECWLRTLEQRRLRRAA